MRGPDPGSTGGPVAPSGEPVEVRRSARRRKTVSAFRENGKLVVAIPADFTLEQEREWVAKMSGRLIAKEARRRLGDDDLVRRAQQLSERYLEGAANPITVSWADNQLKRWGSASRGDRSIRLSRQLVGMPDWVVDYVLLHELIHLVAPRGHGPEFRAALARYPEARLAEGFLQGVAWARFTGPGSTADDAVPHPVQPSLPWPGK